MAITPWRAAGLLVENCNCQLLCPGHVSFKQRCTNDRCHGHWAIHVDDGQFGDIDLADTNVVIVFDAPQRMYDGDWPRPATSTNGPPRRNVGHSMTSCPVARAVPGAILARFVETRIATRFVPMRFEDAGREKRLTIPDVFDSTVTAISRC